MHCVWFGNTQMPTDVISFPYHNGKSPANYPVPAIPIEVTYDMMVEGSYGFWDLWIGHNPCNHIGFQIGPK
jgi:hypothetical protein